MYIKLRVVAMSPKLSHRIGEIMQQNEDNGIKNSADDEPQLFLIYIYTQIM